jgi:hypothetical protein
MNELEKYSKNTDVAVLRAIFGAVPLVGTALNELVFDIRGRVKQERLNKFTELFADYFIGKSDFDSDVLKSEDFGDLFEAVLRNVVQTKSEAKYRRYSDILIKQIENKLPNADNSARYLELISVLDEMEILILYNHRVFDTSFKINEERLQSMKEEKRNLNLQYNEQLELSAAGHANDKSRIKSDLDNLKLAIDELEESLSEFKIYREASFYRIPESQFMYYKQNLYSKALLNDSAAGGDTYGYSPFMAMSITEFGKEFLNFLINK